MSDAIITFDKVTLEYKSHVGLFKSFTHKAIDNVSFSVQKGEVFGVLGGNGSGKSTLLQMLAGILQPDEGRIVVAPNITRSLLSLGLGFNSQLTGEDNALISCMLNGYSKKDAKLLSKKIEDFSELGKFYTQPVKTYSSGMKSRLGFSTAILSKVDVLLIDEVLSVGDIAFKAKAQNTLLEKINSDLTVVFVSHSDQQIKSLCNRCMWLKNGSMLAQGDTASVMAQYSQNITIKK
ncbi:MAG: ATP-binding cassette domain-containing protein [Sinobacterium sp.]